MRNREFRPIPGHALCRGKRRGFEPLEARRLMTAVDPAAVYSSFVNAAYQDVLGRAADASALGFWTQPSVINFARLPLAEAITHSDEYYSKLVRQDYQQIFGRPPEAAALAFWTDQLHQGVSDEQFEAALLASPEFYARSGGNDSSWLNAVYQQLLNRPLDATGADFWSAQLASGASRFEAAYFITAGGEHIRREIDDDFQHYLGRAVDSAALSNFADQLGSTLTDEEFVARLVATDEYFKRETGISPTIVPVASPLDVAMNPGIAAQLQQGQPNLLFVGDSITWAWQNIGQTTWSQYYASRGAVDAGVPADTTQNVLWRLDQYNFAGVHPKLAIVEIGTNNLGADSPADISAGVAAVVDKLRQEMPGTKILVLGILPRNLSPDDILRQNAVQANQTTSRLADGQTVYYLDLSATFLHSDGTLNTSLFLPDLVHPNAQGYQAWAGAMESEVAALLRS